MDLLAAVREATAAAATARFSHRHRGLTPDGVANPKLGGEGMVDLVAVRARFADGPNETALDGGRMLTRFGDDRCFLDFHYETQGVSIQHPLLPLVSPIALEGEPRREPDTTLRGETVARWAVRLSGPAMERPEPGRLAKTLLRATGTPPPVPPERWTADAELWVDGLMRLRLFGRLLPMLPPLPLPRFLKGPMRERASTADRAVWVSTELWDFGVALPAVELPPPELVVGRRSDPRNRD